LLYLVARSFLIYETSILIGQVLALHFLIYVSSHSSLNLNLFSQLKQALHFLIGL
jgi:hypothetical protein